MAAGAGAGRQEATPSAGTPEVSLDRLTCQLGDGCTAAPGLMAKSSITVVGRLCSPASSSQRPNLSLSGLAKSAGGWRQP